METTAYILSSTGEYPLSNIGAQFIMDNEDYEDLLTFPNIIFDSAYTIPATQENLDKALAYLNDNLTKYPELGDDDYYDYYPDLIDQILFLAAQISRDAFDKTKQEILNNPILLTNHNECVQEHVENESLFQWISDYQWYIDTIEEFKSRL